ncbi:MAG: cytochrome c oxidase subunit 3 [Pyrinomonadaceae bacterium]|nr:cytochrome c oxidase subunit 3 [Pyrinomonadaceae bacterium]MCX7639692.1 cytochrome c oxidase subunit 3 [Pyrinomonadaceae bacterium]MDW8304594.1 cytochrome c oxidase subunit 3 [Acidobacteriota bacterium]
MEVKIGTVETAKEEKLKKRKKLSSSITSGGSDGHNKRGRGGGGSGGGGDNFDDKNPASEIEGFKPKKLKIMMWFLLVVVLMTFSGLISAYLVLATNRTVEWKPFYLPLQVWISTVLILASTFTIEKAKRRIEFHQESAKRWLLATTVLGAMFIASQMLLWLKLFREGVYVQGNPYAGLFYILTIVHAVHVLGGILGLGYVVLRAWERTFNTEELLRRKTSATVLSWYWHTMDMLWIVIIFLLAFYR